MSGLSDKEQYDQLAQDWRQVHNIIWGIPSIAIAIITGIIVAAYQPELVGWPRIIALTIGSIFLFSLTVEIIKKRLLMNAISVRLVYLEKKNGLKSFPFETDALFAEVEKYYNERTDEYEEKKQQEIEKKKEKEVKKSLKKPGNADNRDPVYILFKKSYARQYLGYVVFVAAIIVSILTYWEFIKYLNYTELAYWLGISPIVIICLVIAIIRVRN